MRSKNYSEYRERWNNNPKDYKVDDFPLHIDIETITTCNLKCKMCYQSFDTPKYGKMDLDTFNKIILEIKDMGLDSVKLQYRNEPLTDIRLPLFVEACKKCDVLETSINTNGLLLDEKKSISLIRSGLDKISFSLDGCDKKTYESIRIGSDYDKVIDNICRFVDIRDSMNSNTPSIDIKTINMESIDIEEYVEKWKNIVDTVSVAKLANLQKEEDWNEYPNFSCPDLWRRLTVIYNGDVVPCCCGTRGNTVYNVLGNTNKQTIESIWNGENLNNIRELHKEGKSHTIHMCRMCEAFR